MTEELAYKSGTELARLIAERRLSPVELVETELDRIERLDGVLHSYVSLRADEAMAEARAAEARVMRGEDLGPLHGVPIAVKDVIDVEGARTTATSRIMAGHVARSDAAVVRRAKQAGAIVLGKLACDEFAFGRGVHPSYEPPRNPWDISRETGGSSSGCAVATAAGLAVLTLGTDTGGSIRHPAAMCGIVGLKPTASLVSGQGVVPVSWSFDTVGPMARTAEDAMLLLGVLAEEAKAVGLTRGGAGGYVRIAEDTIKGMRIGIPRVGFFDNLDVEVEKAISEFLRVLESLGAVTVEVSFPRLGLVQAIYPLILCAEASSYHESTLRSRPHDFGPAIRERLELGRMILATDYVNAQRCRTVAIREYGALMKKVTVLVIPTSPSPARKLKGSPSAQQWSDEASGGGVNHLAPFNVVGAPALSLPCGFSANGLPIGVQIAGRPFDEASVLHVAHVYETETAWNLIQPHV